MERGWKTKETQGLFNIIYPEGVSSFRDRRSWIQRWRFQPGGQRRPAAEPQHGGAIAAAWKLVGDVEFLLSVRQIEKRDHGETEEEVASSPRGLTRPGKE